MTDRVSPARRSRIMASVGTRNTKPELQLRKSLHQLGYRFRLHAKDLPGKPDLVFRTRRKAIFVHGCFWHGHECKWGKLPKSRLDYWVPKIRANRERDERTVASLRELGWSVAEVWQCELKDMDSAVGRVRKFLGPIGSNIVGSGSSLRRGKSNG